MRFLLLIKSLPSDVRVRLRCLFFIIATVFNFLNDSIKEFLRNEEVQHGNYRPAPHVS